MAAQMANKAKIGDIAGQLAREKYDLVSLANDIQNEKLNRTRFAALGKFELMDGTDQTSIIMGVRDQVGAMHKVVESFAKIMSLYVDLNLDQRGRIAFMHGSICFILI